MPSTQMMPDVVAAQLPLMRAAELQDSLLVVVHDLDPLRGLLANTAENLPELLNALDPSC